MRTLIAMLVVASIANAADSVISKERAEELKAYIESRRKSDIDTIQKRIKGLRVQQIPASQKVALRKEYEEKLKHVKSPMYVPSLSLTSPKGIGIVKLNGKVTSDPYARVFQVVGKDEFLMSVYRQVYEQPTKSGRISVEEAGNAIQDALLAEPRQVHQGDIMVSGVSTANLRTDQKGPLKISGTFIVAGTKTYTTALGASRTVPLIREINREDVNKLLKTE